MKSSGVYKSLALDKLRGNWGDFICATLIYLAITGLFSFSSNMINIDGIGTDNGTGFLIIGVIAIILLSLLVTVFQGVLQVGIYKIGFDYAEDNRTSINRLWSGFMCFGKIAVFYLVYNLLTVLLSLLLIIPGIIFYYTYCMVPLILADNPEMDLMDAVNLSARMMKGNKMNYFFLGMSFIGWILLSSCCSCGIGMIFIIPYQTVAQVLFYKDILSEIENDRLYDKPYF